MAKPTTRAEFKENCLRRLGKPVVEINVDDDQVEDRIDEALTYYYDYHFDGSEKIYFKYVLTEIDFTNRYILLPENIIGAVNIFDMGLGLGTTDLFSITYQIAMNEVFSFMGTQMLPYYMARTNLASLQEMLVGKAMFRYNRHTNKFYLDMNWDRLNVGDTLVIEAYEVVDPETYTDAWSDRWLLQYTACLIKQQWGTNLKKFSGMKMPGGLTFNGQAIYDEATTERAALEKEMIYTYSLPVTDMIG